MRVYKWDVFIGAKHIYSVFFAEKATEQDVLKNLVDTEQLDADGVKSGLIRAYRRSFA